MSRETSSALEIHEVDPFDDALVEAWHATYLAADGLGREDPISWRLEECRAELQSTSRRRRFTAYAGLVGGKVVTTAGVSLPLLDNLTQLNFEIYTGPDHRCRGHASAMLDHVEGLARAAGRTVLLTEVTYPYDCPADGAGHPNSDFATRRGFEFGLGDVRRTLRLPLGEELLARLAGEAAPHHTGYTLRSFSGPVPEDLVDSYAVISASLNTEAPAGEITREAENADVEVFREGEEMVVKQGRTKYATAALDADGEVAAYTDLVTTVHEPGRSYQWGTLARKQDRGHRLGMAVKVANLAFLQGERPDIEAVSTYNAEVNAHMVSVNDALGFEPVERMGEFQKRI